MTSEQRHGREFDLVIYGATGFVGKLLSDYLARFAPSGVRIALAGRSQSKLVALRETLPSPANSWPIIVADADDEDALDSLAGRTKVVVTTVGPYLKYGLPLVAACARNGTTTPTSPVRRSS